MITKASDGYISTTALKGITNADSQKAHVI